jgi:cytochrome b involved in lipid metabolism
MTDRKIGFEELCKHDKIEDLWLAIDGIVYDVTPFMDDHPGGGEIMLSAANKDGTDDFEDVGHSPHARELLKKFKVGVFEGEFGEGAPKKKSGGRDDVSIGGNAVLGMVLPVLVLLCAIAAYYMGMQR